jgi:DMSO/TMAO reductase YedYZ molybdopterin-dependent catalytic subunit
VTKNWLFFQKGIKTSMLHIYRMKKIVDRKWWYVAISVLIASMVFMSVFFLSTPRELYPQEILEYEGENLSSIGRIFDNAIKGTQRIDNSSYRLSVNGLVAESQSLSYEGVLKLYPNYRKVVTLFCVEGWSAKILWEGVLVRDLLEDAGVLSNATAVIFTAADGYTTSIPLDYFYEKDILIAYKMNGVVIPQEKGFPFQLVAESKYGYKWIKWVTEITLSDNLNYKGYWERRGYPDEADIH